VGVHQYRVGNNYQGVEKKEKTGNLLILKKHPASLGEKKKRSQWSFQKRSDRLETRNPMEKDAGGSSRGEKKPKEKKITKSARGEVSGMTKDKGPIAKKKKGCP